MSPLHSESLSRGLILYAEFDPASLSWTWWGAARSRGCHLRRLRRNPQPPLYRRQGIPGVAGSSEGHRECGLRTCRAWRGGGQQGAHSLLSAPPGWRTGAWLGHWVVRVLQASQRRKNGGGWCPVCGGAPALGSQRPGQAASPRKPPPPLLCILAGSGPCEP